MDDLTKTMLERAPAWKAPPASAGPTTPVAGAPNIPTGTPPRWERFNTAQKMMDGYRNGWNPNPILTRITEGK